MKDSCQETKGFVDWKKSVCLLAWNEYAKWLSFHTTSVRALQVVFVSDIPPTFRGDWRIVYAYVALPSDSRFIC